MAHGNDNSQVARFYQDRAVFVTGGTGFIGKVFLEKLLRSCPGMKRVYFLIRTKRGEEPKERLATILDSQVFERLKQEQPSAFAKVTAMPGDIALPSLGLSESHRATVVEEVSVVFHLAATIKFDEPLKLAIQLNVLGTRRVLDICKRIQNLSAFVHVSTAYSNCEKKVAVDEVIYQPCVDVEKVFAAAQCSDDNAGDNQDEFLFGMPNTYTLTKRLAELLLRDESGSTPVAIVRPSIVTASWKEPSPGWIDNFAGCTGVIASAGAGLLPSMIMKKDCRMDAIPVDMVANMLICVAWHIAITRPEHVKVYHCTSSDFSSLTMGDMTSAVQDAILRHPLPNLTRYPKFAVTSSDLWHNANLWCLLYLPAFVADLALHIIGQKPRFVQRYRKVRKYMNDARYFATHSWLFLSNNVKGMVDDLSPAAKRDGYKASNTKHCLHELLRLQLFSLDIQNIEWRPYWEQYMLGIRKYLFKAEDDTLPDARRHLKWLYAVHLSLRLFLLIAMFRLLMTETVWELGYSTVMVVTRLWETLLSCDPCDHHSPTQRWHGLPRLRAALGRASSCEVAGKKNFPPASRDN